MHEFIPQSKNYILDNVQISIVSILDEEKPAALFIEKDANWGKSCYTRRKAFSFPWKRMNHPSMSIGTSVSSSIQGSNSIFQHFRRGD